MVLHVKAEVSDHMNEKLCRPYSKEEVVQALNQTHLSKAPDLIVWTHFFNQKYWDIVVKDVSKAVLAILEGEEMPPKF